jgi:hypothetical protein
MNHLLHKDGSQIHVLKELQENIKEGLQVDPTTKNIMKQGRGGEDKEVLSS